jgi:hypothetical protein
MTGIFGTDPALGRLQNSCATPFTSADDASMRGTIDVWWRWHGGGHFCLIKTQQ